MEKKTCPVCGHPVVNGEIVMKFNTFFMPENVEPSDIIWFSKKNLEKHDCVRLSGERIAWQCPKCRTVTIPY